MTAGIAWMLLRTPVRVDSEAQEPAPLATPSAETRMIDFELLEQTVPDENYRPVYPGTLSPLDGRTVRIRGFMTPYDDLENLATFMVMGFPTGCNFCAPPAVNQVVLARQPERKGAYPYIDGPIEVTGTLALWTPDSADPAHRDEYFLYIMNDVRVKSLPASAFRPPTEHRLGPGL
jgi:hypothetical protein